MPTVPSAAASAFAARLVGEGLNVTAGLVQRWRERGLLGDWDHLHRGGPGSAAVPDEDAYLRARLLARLPEDDRTTPTVTLLALPIGLSVEPRKLGEAVTAWYRPMHNQVTKAAGDEPIDRAENAVARLSEGRRAKQKIKQRAAALAATPDLEHWFEDDEARSPEERYADFMTAFLAAVGGDGTWLPSTVGDGLRLSGLGELAEALGFDDRVVAAELGMATAQTTELMLRADNAVENLTADDVTAVRDSIAMLDSIGLFDATSGQTIEDLAHGTTLIDNAPVIGGVVAAIVVSQLGLPDTLRSGLARALGLSPTPNSS